LCQIYAEGTLDEFTLAAARHILKPGECVERAALLGEILRLAQACDPRANRRSLEVRLSAVVNSYIELFPVSAAGDRVCRLGERNAHVYMLLVSRELKALFKAEQQCREPRGDARPAKTLDRALELSRRCLAAALAYFDDHELLALCAVYSDGAGGDVYVGAGPGELAEYLKKHIARHIRDPLLLSSLLRQGPRFVVDDLVDYFELYDSVYTALFAAARDAWLDARSRALRYAIEFAAHRVVQKSQLNALLRGLCRDGQRGEQAGGAPAGP